MFDSGMQEKVEAARRKYNEFLSERTSRLCDELGLEAEVIDRLRISLNSHQDWKTLQQDLQRAADVATAKDGRCVKDQLRRKMASLGKKMAKYEPAMTKWLALFPNNIYGSVICGAFKIIFTVYKDSHTSSHAGID